MAETLREVIGPATLAARVAALGAEISRCYAGRELVMVGVLKGAVVFLSDLLRHLTFCPLVDFVRLASYRDQTKPGALRFILDLDTPVAGRDVLIVEDIVDTGRSMAFLRSVLLARHPASVKICTLLDKRACREVDVTADFVGFEVGEGFLVGYGLDYAERFRRLPGIFELIQ